MDVTWFKKQQKKADVTAEDIAREMGRDRSIVSHIYNGRQRMSIDWARAFAKVLDVPLDEVLEHAGMLEAPQARTIRPGFSEGDAVPFTPAPSASDDLDARARAFGGGRPGVDVWQVRGGAMTLGGYLPGDMLLVDTHQTERLNAGDIVVAQRYDNQTGTAITMLRRHEPPVLVSATADPADQRVHFVDGTNVVVRGKVIASWRTP